LVLLGGNRYVRKLHSWRLGPDRSALEGIWLLRNIKHQAPDGSLIGDG